MKAMTISRRQFVFGSLGGMLILSGCSGGGDTIESRTEAEQRVGNGGLQGFLFKGKVLADYPGDEDVNGVDYIEWTESNGQLTGTYYRTWYWYSYTLYPSQYPLAGTLNGNSVTLRFGNLSQSGTLSGKTLTLRSVGPGATSVTQMVFTAASINDYTAAVATLKATGGTG